MGPKAKPREMIWLVGLGSFRHVMGFGFTGYLLPGSASHWATTVGVEIMDKTPIVGAHRPVFKGGPTLGRR